MYRVYIRTADQTVSHKTVTASPVVAEAAYRELLNNREFWGKKLAAVLSLDGRQLEFRRFDRIVSVSPRNQRELESENRRPLYLPQIDGTPPDPETVIYCHHRADLIDAPLSGRKIRLHHDDLTMMPLELETEDD